MALAKQGIMSAQASDEAETSLQANQAAVETAKENVAAAEASLRQAQAHELQTDVAARTVASTRGTAAERAGPGRPGRCANWAIRKVFSPIDGKVNVWAARQGEVVGAGTPIVTIMDLTQTWVYAPLPETQADAVQLGDSLRVVMPSGATVEGKVIAKSALSGFCDAARHQRRPQARHQDGAAEAADRQSRARSFVPGMTADVYIPKAKLVKP